MSSTATSTIAPTPLRDPKLRRIVAAYTVNRLGTWFGFIALSVAVYEHTHSAIAVAALLVAGQVLPAFVVPALVARVEAASRRGELSALYLFEAAATAALAGLVWRFWLPGILLLVALDGTAALAASALLRAAAARAAREWSYDRHALTLPAPGNLSAHTYAGQAGIALAAGESGIGGPELGGGDGVDRSGIDPREASALEAERKANAAINIGFAVTFTLGPALAGLAVPAFGAPAALLIDAVSFVICAAMLIDLRPHSDDAETSSVRARVRAAWRHINEAPGVARPAAGGGRGARVLRVLSADRGRLREVHAARRGRRLRPAAGRVGPRCRGRQHRVRALDPAVAGDAVERLDAGRRGSRTSAGRSRRRSRSRVRPG